MNETLRGSRLHLAIFGRRNAGKSSLINALTNQNTAIVSDTLIVHCGACMTKRREMMRGLRWPAVRGSLLSITEY